MTPIRPAGFRFLCACALLCACMMAWGLASSDAVVLFGPPGRLAVAATGALALVTAEALAFGRPWVFRASVAFALAFLAMIAVITRSLELTVMFGGVSGLFILVALGIVSHGVDVLNGRAPGAPRVAP